MRQVDIHEAARTLSQLVEAAEAGEQVILTRAGQPVVEIVRANPAARGIKLGLFKGRLPDGLVDSIRERPLI